MPETYYKITMCKELMCTDEPLPTGFAGRGETHGNNQDRIVASGTMGNSLFVSQHGSFLFELFTVLVDLTKRDEEWTIENSADIKSISSVFTTNYTVVPGVKPPMFNPPQDFYSGPLNVTLEMGLHPEDFNASGALPLSSPAPGLMVSDQPLAAPVSRPASRVSPALADLYAHVWVP